MNAAERLGAILADGTNAIENLRRVLDFIDDTKPPSELRVLMTNSVIVTAVSTLEETLRQLFIEYLTIVEERIDSYKRLRGELRDANAEKFVEVLRKSFKEKNENEALKLVDDLRKCLAGEAGYQLRKDEITHNKGNFRSFQLTDIAKLIGLNEIWRKIAHDESVANYIGIELGETCTQRLISDWNAIFDERDVIVHRISQASGWGVERVEQGIDLVLLVLGRFANCLTADLLIVIPAEAE